jgi:hypothetical protein
MGRLRLVAKEQCYCYGYGILEGSATFAHVRRLTAAIFNATPRPGIFNGQLQIPKLIWFNRFVFL